MWCRSEGGEAWLSQGHDSGWQTAKDAPFLQSQSQHDMDDEEGEGAQDASNPQAPDAGR